MQVNDAPNIFRRDHLDSTPGIDFCLQLFSGDTINIHRPGCEAVAELAVMCWKGPIFLEHFDLLLALYTLEPESGRSCERKRPEILRPPRRDVRKPGGAEACPGRILKKKERGKGRKTAEKGGKGRKVLSIFFIFLSLPNSRRTWA